jgi:hypothetical protein
MLLESGYSDDALLQTEECRSASISSQGVHA